MTSPWQGVETAHHFEEALWQPPESPVASQGPQGVQSGSGAAVQTEPVTDPSRGLPSVKAFTTRSLRCAAPPPAACPGPPSRSVRWRWLCLHWLKPRAPHPPAPRRRPRASSSPARPRPPTVRCATSRPPTTWSASCAPTASAACPTRTPPRRCSACPACRSNATRAKAATCASAGSGRISTPSRSTAASCRRPRTAAARWRSTCCLRRWCARLSSPRP